MPDEIKAASLPITNLQNHKLVYKENTLGVDWGSEKSLTARVAASECARVDDNRKNIEYNLIPECEPDAEPGEKRGEPRFALLLRSAKLVCPSGEFLCVVRDVSEGGLKLRLFHDLPPDELMELELATGERFGVAPVWQRSGEAGFRFTDPVDLHRFITETGPYPRRPIRVKLTTPAVLILGGEEVPAMIRDLSCHGARIEIDRALALRQALRIEAPKLPRIEAMVCWRKRPDYGIAFRQLFTLEDLAVLAAGLQGLLAGPSHRRNKRRA